MLKASNRNSSLMFSALGMEKDLCKEASNFTNPEPLAASLPTLPFTNLKSTASPVTASIAPLLLTGAMKVFWIPLHCAAGKPAAMHLATAPGPNRALPPSKDAMPEVEMVPSGRTLGRCWVSLPAPKNLPLLPKPELPVERGYGRPDWIWPTQLNPRLLAKTPAHLLPVIRPESRTTPMLAA